MDTINMKQINSNFMELRQKQAELKKTRNNGLKIAVSKIESILNKELLKAPYKVALKATKQKILAPLLASKVTIDKDTVRVTNLALTLFFRGVPELATIEGLTPAMIENASVFFTVGECKALLECEEGGLVALYKSISSKYKKEATCKKWDASLKKVSAK